MAAPDDRPMKERFKQHESVAEGLRRLAALHLDAALAAAAQDAEADDKELGAAVHEVRKRCKKLRALLRLVRASFPAYADEQALLRDAARGLSRLRDADARHEALQRLVRHHPGRIDGDLLRTTRSMASMGTPVDRRARLHAALGRAAVALSQQRARIGEWQLEDDGFEALQGGLRRTYRSGRKALASLGDAPSPDAMHALRKAVKYHASQLAILAGCWPAPMKAWESEAKALGDRLGEHHDIAMLQAHLQKVGAGSVAAAEFADAVASELRRLEQQSRWLAARLYAETGKAFSARLRGYWEAWRM